MAKEPIERRKCSRCGKLLPEGSHGTRRYCPTCAALRIGEKEKASRDKFVTIALSQELAKELRAHIKKWEKQLPPGCRWSLGGLVGGIVKEWLDKKAKENAQ